MIVMSCSSVERHSSLNLTGTGPGPVTHKPDHSPCQEYHLLQLRGHLHVMGTPGAQTLGVQSGSPVSGAAQLNKDAGKP